MKCSQPSDLRKSLEGFLSILSTRITVFFFCGECVTVDMLAFEDFWIIRWIDAMNASSNLRSLKSRSYSFGMDG